jgi:hypothetical protein
MNPPNILLKNPIDSDSSKEEELPVKKIEKKQPKPQQVLIRAPQENQSHRSEEEKGVLRFKEDQDYEEEESVLNQEYEPDQMTSDRSVGS